MNKFFAIVLSFSLFIAGAAGSECSWCQQIDDQDARLGHRNMIIIADSAFPIQTGTGIQVIVTGVDHAAVVAYAIEAIEACSAVRPLIALDKEFAFVPEEHAPGAADLRKTIITLLEGKSSRPIREALHESLLAEINETAADYTVVVFKTTGVIPYSSVFFTLDCGYWTEEGEQAMRARLAEAK